MNVNFTAKPINFKLGEYMSKGFELLKKDFGNIFVAFLCCFVMAIIPFCGMLGAGNFYLYLRKLNKGQQASPGEIFNFDRFMPYFILQLIVIGGIIALYIPLGIVMITAGALAGDEPAAWVSVIMIPYVIFMYAAIFYFVLKGFYIPALISFKNVTDIKTAWNASKIMTKDNLLSIFLFSLVVGILSQIGVIACGIGLLATLPFMYVANYFAYEDAITQIEHDEISEIGIQEKY
ncbi:hypothetical protein [Chryseobacterium sp. JAH]|uniref:hypothetical protein n=1 Tax=Chryseobacterium sp. JAH TaxID=1742858 RepID=UPI000741300D|nr:hypothetical protein [Chryseobacterium sp. JAH]KUJ51926.1 hypothetical protein AR685_09880 [Chryseobacterium sp. JAH]